jgi:AcrR family transcriptional regulator
VVKCQDVPKSPPKVELQQSPGPNSTGTLQERKQQFVRDAIWDAAIGLFDRKGFDETTVDEIAQAAGTSRRSFFRYFESKSDLLAQSVISYGAALTEAIENCPAEYSLGELFRFTVLQVAQGSVSHPRTRQIMHIAAKYPAAREAQIARVAEVQDRVAEAFARRSGKSNQGELEAQVLAGLTLSMLSVAYLSWFRHGTQDIAATAEQIFGTLADVACFSTAAGKGQSTPASPSATYPVARRQSRKTSFS